jgi:Zn-dependent peptidase ImmA (M78 family)
MNLDIENLTDYLESNEVVVQFEKGGICAFWKSKTFPLITINTNVRGDNRLYVMLHEAGHYLNWKEQLEQDTLLEEQTAWEKGEQLAQKLNIFIDKEKYWSYANRNLNSYLREYLKNAS